MKKINLFLSSLLLLVVITPAANAEDLYWLANKMIKKNTDIPSLFKTIPKGSIVAVLPKYVPQVCDYKNQITHYENSVYTVTSCVYIGKVRKLN